MSSACEPGLGHMQQAQDVGIAQEPFQQQVYMSGYERNKQGLAEGGSGGSCVPG